MITLFLGVPGSGKTTALHDFISGHPDHAFFVKDHAGEWHARHRMWRGRPPMIFHIESEAQLGRIRDESEGEMPAGVYAFGADWWASEVAELCVRQGNVTYVDDELDFACDKWKANPLRLIVHQGRHLRNDQGQICEVNIAGACRKVQSLPTDFALASQVFMFRMQGERALQRLMADGLAREDDLPGVQNLATFHYLHWPSFTWGRVESL